jgi:hypothetical protein
MGVKALRSNSLFCNGSVAVAADYGMVYAIIPCNDAVYAWSRKIHDIILDDLNLDIAGSFLAEPFKTVTPELIKKFQHYFEIDTTDLGEAIKQRHEVWLHGHYVAIPRGEALAMKAELFGSGVNG